MEALSSVLQVHDGRRGFDKVLWTVANGGEPQLVLGRGYDHNAQP